jgi:hypothetical protein
MRRKAKVIQMKDLAHQKSAERYREKNREMCNLRNKISYYKRIIKNLKRR